MTSGRLYERSLRMRLYRRTSSLVRFLNRLMHALIAGMVLLMAIDVLIQVALRQVDRGFGLSTSTGRTEELPSLILVWLALLGGSVAVGDRSHLGIDLLSRFVPPKWRVLNDRFVFCVMLLFSAVVLAWGGYKLLALAAHTGQLTPSWGLSMAGVYLALPLAGCMNIIYLVHLLLQSEVETPENTESASMQAE